MSPYCWTLELYPSFCDYILILLQTYMCACIHVCMCVCMYLSFLAIVSFLEVLLLSLGDETFRHFEHYNWIPQSSDMSGLPSPTLENLFSAKQSAILLRNKSDCHYVQSLLFLNCFPSHLPPAKGPFQTFAPFPFWKAQPSELNWHSFRDISHPSPQPLSHCLPLYSISPLSMQFTYSLL